LRKPRRLRPGNTIGIVAPSSPPPEDELSKGIALIESRGYRVRVGEHVLAKAPHCDYLAGTDEQRAADLNSMFADPAIDGIFCARGGYGAMRLFDLIDWSLVAAHPKVFVGYSDITSLHTALARLGWTTVHGTMVSALWKLEHPMLERLWALVESAAPPGDLPADPETLQTIVPGAAEGELAGGNLCLLAQACGSRFAPDFRGKIVLLEDVNDPVYHADRGPDSAPQRGPPERGRRLRNRLSHRLAQARSGPAPQHARQALDRILHTARPAGDRGIPLRS